MKLFDLETPQTKKSQKVLEGYFGNSVDFTKLAPRAASNMCSAFVLSNVILPRNSLTME